MPLSGSSSGRDPDLTQMPTDADLTCSIRSEIIVKPLSRVVCLMGPACSTISHLNAMLAHASLKAQTTRKLIEHKSRSTRSKASSSVARLFEADKITQTDSRRTSNQS